MKYDAVTVDTNIFAQNGYHLEGGLLAQLAQFKEGSAQFIITEVVLREVRKHMVANAKAAQDALNGALRKAVEQGVAPPGAEETFGNFAAASSPKDAVDKRLINFMRECGGELIRADAVNTKDLVRLYFAPAAPFERSGKKKEEFPDAIALLSLEAWAEAGKKKILAISDDGGWAAFAEGSEWIDVEKDFGKALEILQKDAESATKIIQKVITDVAGGGAERLDMQIRECLDRALLNTEFLPEASSFLHAEGEAAGLEFKRYEFIDDNGEYEVTVVRVGKSSIVARVEAEITAIATADFSFSIWDGVDKEYVGLGGATAETETTFNASLLITFVGDFEDGIEGVEVFEVEVVEAPSVIDFGGIAPDMGKDDEPDFEDYSGSS